MEYPYPTTAGLRQRDRWAPGTRVLPSVALAGMVAVCVMRLIAAGPRPIGANLKGLVRFLALLAALGPGAQAACTREGNTSAGAQDLAVVKADFSVETNQAQRTVVTLGSLANKSGACLEGIVVEVRYFNDQGALVDTVTQPLYGIVAPPHEEVSFRVRDEAAKPKESYAKQSVRVLTAEVRGPRGRPQEPEQGVLLGILLNWGPMALLIAVWWFVMRRLRSKDSPQSRTLALIERQSATLEMQAAQVKRIAESLESAAAKK